MNTSFALLAITTLLINIPFDIKKTVQAGYFSAGNKPY